jgi:hypothetical protein
MASLLDFLNPNGQPGGLFGNLQSPPSQDPQAQPQMQPGAAGPQAGGFGAGVGDFLSNNPLMLMALGGGIAQGGIGRGLTAAVPAAQYEQGQQKQQQAQQATYGALRSAGVPHGQAVAAALNPEVLKTIARSHFGVKPTFETMGPDQHGESITSLNTLVGHIGNLIEAADKLDNKADVSLASQTIKDTKSAANSPFDDSVARNFELARSAVADEMAKVLSASGTNDKEIRSWKDTLSTSNSPTELRVVIGRSIELMKSRLTALQAQYERAIGRSAPEWLSPKSRATLEKIREWTREESPDQQSDR